MRERVTERERERERARDGERRGRSARTELDGAMVLDGGGGVGIIVVPDWLVSRIMNQTEGGGLVHLRNRPPETAPAAQ